METLDLAAFEKKAVNEGRIVVFIDESGLSQKPHCVRTWAPKGQTPVLEFDFNWKKLSVIAGITVWNFYFQFYPGAIRSAQVIAFLKHLQVQIPGKLLIIWDGAAIHRSRAVRDHLDSPPDRSWQPLCQPMLQNSIPPSTSGAISNSTNCPTSAPGTWLN